MTYFPQNPISRPTGFGTSPPRNPREAADTIMAYLDREATGAAIPRTPFAPFLAETYERPAGGGEGGYEPAARLGMAGALNPLGIEEEREAELPMPYPDARTDDERIRERDVAVGEQSHSG